MKKKYDYFIYYFPLFAFLFIGMGSILLSVFTTDYYSIFYR